MCLDFILLLKLTSYLRPLQSSSSPPLLSCSEARTTLFYFSFTSLPSLLFVISFYTGVDSHSIYRGWIHTMEGSRRTRSKNFFLLRIYSCTDTGWGRGGRLYIASSIELIRRGGGLFTHIIFLPLYTFSPNYFFLRNSVRRDDDRVLYVSFLPSKKAWGLNLPLTSVITLFSLLYRRRDINTMAIIVSLFSIPLFSFPRCQEIPRIYPQTEEGKSSLIFLMGSKTSNFQFNF